MSITGLVPEATWDEVSIQEKEVLGIYIKKSENDFLLFLEGLVIPSASGPQLFFDCMADFQREAFLSLGPSLISLRDGRVPKIRRFWIERTKKSAKDSDLAAVIMWLMAFPKRPFKCQIVASNFKQAGILRNRVIEILHYNTWLNELVEVIGGQIRNKNQHKEIWTKIESTDTGGAAQGEAPELLILNELVHVTKWEVMQAHMNNALGVPMNVTIVSTNAGIKGTPAESWRKIALEEGSRWKPHIWSSPSPWSDPEDIKEARRLDPIGMEFARLWEGKWISGIGSALDEFTIDACFCLEGPTKRRKEGMFYYGGLDLGISHDHAGVVVLGVSHSENKVKLVYFEGFSPCVPVGKKLEVDLVKVEKRCSQVYEKYGITWFGYDPAAGGSFMAQRLRLVGVPMQEVCFSSRSVRTTMATTFVQAMKERKVECYDDANKTLRRDFGKFNIEHRPPSSYCLTAVSDEFGHADVGTAFVIALPPAASSLDFFYDSSAGMDLVYDYDSLSGKELKRMPAEFQDILENEHQDTWEMD